jgi:uncharacterized protein (DUF2336 family)
MDDENLSIIDELDEALRSESSEKRVETLRRVTDLFLSDADRLSAKQIDVFDHVLQHMIERIEAKTLAELSVRLSPVDNAPIGTIRALARNGEISVAGPILSNSSRLTNDDLIEIASSRSQAHLLAISGRARIDEAVTDILVQRGNREVARKVAGNVGASFSETGFATLVGASQSDALLAEKAGLRIDLPLKFLKELLQRATDAVRSRLLAGASSDVQAEMRRILGDISESAGRELMASRHFTTAEQLIADLSERGKLNETTLLQFATAGQYEETVAALAAMSGTSVAMTRPLMQSARDDGLLILCKAIGVGWKTLSGVMKVRFSSGGLTDAQIEKVRIAFDKLKKADADRMLRFWKVRLSTSAAS